MLRFTLLSALLALAPAVPTRAGGHFARGINNTDYLVYPGASTWPMFQSEWASISKAQLLCLAHSGFTFVRLGVGVEPWMTLPSHQIHLLEARLEQFLDLAEAAKLAVVVTGFALYESPHWSPPQILATPSGVKFQAYTGFMLRLAEMLERRRSDKLALELMNEPQAELRRSGARDWTVIQKQLFDRVREVAPNLVIVLSPSNWSSIDGLDMLDMSAYDQRTMIDIHFYEPYPFTHQGTDWAEEPVSYLAGLAYPCALTDRQTALAATEAMMRSRRPTISQSELADALRRASGAIDAYLSEQCDVATIGRRLELISEWARRQKIDPARIIIGEFGAMKPSPPAIEDGSRFRWIEAVRSESERRGFGWAIYVSDAKFGLYLDHERLNLESGILHALGFAGKPSC